MCWEILPPACLGIVGGGQLGRLFCFAAQALGYRVCVFDPDPSSPAAQVANCCICAPIDDFSALAKFAQQCAAISIEFEHIPLESLNFLAQRTRLSPSPENVALAQDRILEKQSIAQCGFAVAPYCVIDTESISSSFERFAAYFPGILKTACLGYDGKGQSTVCNYAELSAAFQKFGAVPCVLEKCLALASELSVLVACGQRGDKMHSVVYPVMHNIHRAGILAQTQVPASVAGISEAIAQSAQNSALFLAQHWNYIGVLCVEFFVLENGQLVVNEVAPRPHNSAHYTLDACITSQFEQQVRALTGLPLGSTRLVEPAVMLNLLGDLWCNIRDQRSGTEREIAKNNINRIRKAISLILNIPGAHLYLYGKETAKPGRKMGHITLTAQNIELLRSNVGKAKTILGL